MLTLVALAANRIRYRFAHKKDLKGGLFEHEGWDNSRLMKLWRKASPQNPCRMCIYIYTHIIYICIISKATAFARAVDRKILYAEPRLGSWSSLILVQNLPTPSASRRLKSGSSDGTIQVAGPNICPSQKVSSLPCKWT